MKEAKKSKVEEKKTFVAVEIDSEGRVNTKSDGNTLVLFGLLEVARQNLIQRLQTAPRAEPG